MNADPDGGPGMVDPRIISPGPEDEPPIDDRNSEMGVPADGDAGTPVDRPAVEEGRDDPGLVDPRSDVGGANPPR